MTKSPPEVGSFFAYMLAIIAVFVLAMPWIITGIQHYYYWVFTVTGSK